MKLIRVSIKEIIYDYSISIENHLEKRLLLSKLCYPMDSCIRIPTLQKWPRKVSFTC